MDDYRVKVRAKSRTHIHATKDDIADAFLKTVEECQEILDISFEGAGKGAPMRFCVSGNFGPQGTSLLPLLQPALTLYVQDNYYDLEVVEAKYIGKTEE